MMALAYAESLERDVAFLRSCAESDLKIKMRQRDEIVRWRALLYEVVGEAVAERLYRDPEHAARGRGGRVTAPYYSDESVTIYHGDCRAVELPREGVSCVVTSPPYNVGLSYDEHNDALDWGDYHDLAVRTCEVLSEALHAGGRLWINSTPVVPVEILAPGNHPGRCSKARLSLLSLWLDAIAQADLYLRDIISWPTPGRGPGFAWGSWASPAAPNLPGEWEAIIVASQGRWGARHQKRGRTGKTPTLARTGPPWSPTSGRCSRSPTRTTRHPSR